MHFSKNDTFSLLRNFSKNEIRKFGLFLDSPYFTNSKKLIELFSLVRKHYPLFTDIELEKENIHFCLYPGEPFIDATIRNLFSDLHKKALEFLTLENLENSSEDKLVLLLQELNKRNLKDEFSKAVKGYEDSDKKMDFRYFLTKHNIEAQKFNFSYVHEKISNKFDIAIKAQYIEDSTRNLVLYFFTELSTHYISLIINSKIFNIDFSRSFLKNASEIFSIEKFREIIPHDDSYNIFIELYSALIKMYTNTSEENLYFEYKNLLQKYSEFLSKEEITVHINYLLSYCTGKGKNHKIFQNERFLLYTFMLENKLHSGRKNQYLTYQLFRNILLLGLELKKFDWVASFIDTYSEEVQPIDRKNMQNLGKAHLYFNTGEYSEALDYINKIELDFFINKFDVRNLKLMIYFELGYHEEALCLIKTYHEFLRKNKVISPERKKRYFSFIKFTEKLLNYRLNNSKQDLGYIKHRIKTHNSTAFKSWLTEKVQILESGFSQIA